MFVIVGIVFVIAAILGGYAMEHGKIAVLLQPAELVIIGGAALGTVLIANPLHVLKSIASGVGRVIRGSRLTHQRYMDTLKMMYELLNKARRDGFLSIESDMEEPSKSKILSRYPSFLADHHALAFLCDTMRMVISGGMNPFDLDQMMELDMEVHHEGASQPVAALQSMADSLPGLGIVAAVLGVVITMGALGGPPEEIGHKVAAALVGTFLGILLCYGFVGPVSANMAKAVEEQQAYLHVLRVIIIASVRQNPPMIAVEFGRRAVPSHVRPGFAEAEKACKAAAPVVSQTAAATA